MKTKLTILLIIGAVAFSARAQFLRVDTNGVVQGTNFFTTNALAILNGLVQKANVRTNMASATVHGYMSSNDWATFNAKQAALGYTPATNSLSGISNAQGFQSVAPTDSRQLTFTSAANDLHGNLSGTNASLTNIYIGGVLVFEQTTNIVTFSGAGNLTNNVDHSWNASLGVHTNEQFHSIVTFQNPTFYLRTADGVNQYSAASLLGPWSAVFGATNAPTSKYGYNFRLTGGQLIGLLSATNLADQIRTYAIPMPTNSGVDGLFASYSGGKTKWAQPQIDTSTATNVNENAFRFTFQKGSILNTNAFFISGGVNALTNVNGGTAPFPVDGTATWAASGDSGPAWYIRNGIQYGDNGWRAQWLGSNYYVLINTAFPDEASHFSTNFPYSWIPFAITLTPASSFYTLFTSAPLTGTPVTPWADNARAAQTAVSPMITAVNAFRLPTRGWDTFGSISGTDVDEFTFTNTVAKFLADGLIAAGWRNFTLDEGWCQFSRDTNGNQRARTAITDGIPALADYVHNRGALLGIHTGLGLDNSSIAPGSQYHEHQDATNFIGTFHADKIDIDAYSANYDATITNEQGVVEAFYDELLKASVTYNRPVHVNVNFVTMYPHAFQRYLTEFNWWNIEDDGYVGTSAPTAWTTFKNRWYGTLSNLQYIRPGSFPTSSTIGFFGNDTNYFSGVMGMIAMAPMSTFVFGTNYNAAILDIMKNEDLKNLHFDEDCRPGFLISSNANVEIYGRPISGGRRALAFFYPSGTNPGSVSANLSDIGLSTNVPCDFRNVFYRTNGTCTGTLADAGATNTVRLYILTPVTTITNAAPSSVTIGTTTADYWVRQIMPNGAVGYTPVWTNH
jgi:hypothetical protein